MLSMVEGVAMDSTMDLDDSRVQNLGQRVTKDRRRDFLRVQVFRGSFLTNL